MFLCVNDVPPADLNDLYFFASVVNHGGFSAAARALGVPKSRLSKHVARLEERLGLRLVERTTRKFRVTELGEAFHRQCEAVVAGAEEAEALVQRARAEPHGTLRVACPPGFSNHVLADMLPGFMRAYPRLRVQLMISNRRVDIIEERIDVAIRIRTSLDSDPSLTLRVLGNSRLVLVASPGFAATHAAALTPGALGGLPTLSFREEAEQQAWTLGNAAGETVTVTHRPLLRCGDFNVLRAAAVAGHGVALLAEDDVAEALASGSLVQVMPAWAATDGIIHMVFASKQGLLPASRAFIDHVAREYPAAARRWQARAA